LGEQHRIGNVALEARIGRSEVGCGELRGGAALGPRSARYKSGRTPGSRRLCTQLPWSLDAKRKIEKPRARARRAERVTVFFFEELALAIRQYDPDGLLFVHHGVGSEEWSGDGFVRRGAN
jgi:hypothetical protein